MKQEESNNFLETSEINFGRFLRLILLQSKMVVAITLAGLILGLSLYFATSKTYKIASLLQVYSPQKTFDPRDSMSLDFFNAPETNLENLITLYSSRSNVLQLIKNLNLNVNVENLEDNEVLKINSFFYKKNDKILDRIFYLQFQDNFFNLLDHEKNIILKGESGKYSENENVEIQIEFSNLNSEKLIELEYENPSNLYNNLKDRLVIENKGNSRNFWSQEGLIEVSYETTDIYEGMKVLNSANEIFINDSIKVETEKARSSIVFIDSQLASLEKILNIRKSELKSFKQKNKSLNVNLEIETIIESISNIDREINKVDLEISKAEINFTKDNPLYKNLKIQKEALELQKNSIEQKIESLPNAQQEYIDLFRTLEVSEEMYSELVSRKLNYSLMEASSIGNIRVVDRAFLKEVTGPNLSSSFLLTVISFSLSILIAIFRGIFFISISNPAEIKDAGINESIVGVIPQVDDTVDPFKDIKFEQSIENLILNLETMISYNQDSESISTCKKITFTSPSPQNGKSFISKNTSELLANIGNKVLLIDADLKRGIQHKLFNRDSLELSMFDNISLENIEELKIKNNLYLLPRLKKLKNTFEHLYSSSFLEKIKEFESYFDYIVIDTAPALSVSDTGLLMTFSDINLLVSRHQYSRINEIKQTTQIIDQLGRSFDGIIYNGYKKPKGYYGYYDLYGDYSYRYYAERYLYDDDYMENDD